MSNDALGATINYSRSFTPLIEGNMSLGYTDNTARTFGSPPTHARSVSLSAQLLYNLSDSTTINVLENVLPNNVGEFGKQLADAIN